jgi:TPR repeat protein
MVPVAAAASNDAFPVSAPAPIAAPPIDPLQVVAARVQARRPSSNDLAWLAQAARDGNVRAIELLAWCKLNAIGMARDPVEAFLLYGAAGSAALPHARENQRLIFERDLDSVQRQQVLDLANEGVTLARLIAGAR